MATGEDSHTFTAYIYRTDTTSTNDTEDDRPGPGRGLDRLFQLGGRRLERLVQNMTRRPIQHSSLVRLQRIDTTSTNATEDDRPGPGRGLDKLYQASGRKLERLLGVAAERMGFGPAATERSIVNVMYRLRESGHYVERRFKSEVWKPYTSKDKHKMDKKVMRRCKSLLKYLSSSTLSTQKRALTALVEVMTTDPTRVDVKNHAMDDILSLHHFLLFMKSCEQSESAQLWKKCYDTSFDEELLDGLLFDSRRALFVCDDNEVNRVMKILSEMSLASMSDSPPDRTQVRLAVRQFSQFLLHPDLSFLAITYINANNSPLSTFTRTGNEDCIDVDIELELLRNLCAIFPSQVVQSTSPDAEELTYSIRALIRRADAIQRFLPPEKRISDGLLHRQSRLEISENQPLLLAVNARELCSALNLLAFDLQDYVSSYHFAMLETPLESLQKRLEEIHNDDLPRLQLHDADYANTLTNIYQSLERNMALECTVADEYQRFVEVFVCEKCARAEREGEPSHGGSSGVVECRHMKDSFTDDLEKRDFFAMSNAERVEQFRALQQQ